MLDYLVTQFYRTFVEQQRYQLFLTGLKNTLVISLFASLLGIALGVVVAVCKVYTVQTGRLRLLDKLLSAYIAIIRGTPITIQMLITAYIIMSNTNNYVLVACVAFGFNSGAYVSEVIRAGILAVDHGQNEAGMSLGMSRAMTMRYIILPQAVKNILPALCNELSAIIKETAIVGIIAVTDLTRASDVVRSRTMDPYFPLLSIAAVYFLIVSGVTSLSTRLEKRLAQSNR